MTLHPDAGLPCDAAEVGAVDWLQVKLSRVEDLLDNDDKLLVLACTLERVPGKQNWVDKTGGLPRYICEVAKSIHQKRGLPIGRAISIAVGSMKNWASGRGDVDPDTRAKAAKALAEWESKKARSKAQSRKD